MKMNIFSFLVAYCICLAYADPKIQFNSNPRESKIFDKKDNKSTVSTPTMPSKILSTLKQEPLPNMAKPFPIGQNPIDSNESSERGIDLVPVSMQHPLFKIFGINPQDYVVYYKYKHGDLEDDRLPDVQFPASMSEIMSNAIFKREYAPQQFVQKEKKRTFKRSHKRKTKREPAPVSLIDDLAKDCNGTDSSSEEFFELVPTNGCGNCGQPPVVIVPVPYPCGCGGNCGSPCSCCNTNDTVPTVPPTLRKRNTNPFPYMPLELLHGQEFDQKAIPFDIEAQGVYNRKRRVVKYTPEDEKKK